MRKERNIALSPRRNPRERDGFQESYLLTSGELRKCTTLPNQKYISVGSNQNVLVTLTGKCKTLRKMMDQLITNLLLSITSALWLGRNWL